MRNYRERLSEILPKELIEQFWNDTLTHDVFTSAAIDGDSCEEALIRLAQLQFRERTDLFETIKKQMQCVQPVIILKDPFATL